MPDSSTTVAISTELIQKYQGEAPRYTSYPTAPNFSDAYTESVYQQHARESNEALLPRDLSLYLHIPFCHSLCYFCGCNKVVTQAANQKVDNYVEMLLREIELKSSLFDGDRRVTQIHFGGGTPNFLSNERLREILEKVAHCFHLDLPSRLEIGIEIDPRSIGASGIKELAQIGFNRFSVGVQDFSKDVQLAVNRVQSEEATKSVIMAANEVSDSVNVDLISGLPRQTTRGFEETLAKVIETGVSRIAVYNFAYLPNRIKAQKLIDPSTLPDAAQRTKISEIARDTLLKAGYIHIGMDHFAKPNDSLAIALKKDTLQRNFQGYTTNAETDLIGFGASAISQFKNAFAQNAPELSSYTSLVQANSLPIQKGFSLSQDDILRAAFIQRIMCCTDIDLLSQTHQFIETGKHERVIDYFAPELQRLQTFAKDNLIELNEHGFRITRPGRYFRRQIAACFDKYLPQNLSAQQVNGSKVVRFSQSL